MSDSQGLVDFTIGLVDFTVGLVNSVVNLPEGQVKFFLMNSNHKRTVINHGHNWAS